MSEEQGTPIRRQRSVARFGAADGRRVVLDDPEALKVLYDPLRFEIVGLLGEPRSVKDLAEALDRKPAGLYHHIGLLEEKGLIEVAFEDVVKGRVVKRYVRSASEYETAEDLSGLLAGVMADRDLEGVVHHVRRALRAEGEGEGQRIRVMADVGTRLTFDQASDLAEAIRTFVDDHVAAPAESAADDQPEGATGYRLVIALAPQEDT